MDKRGYSVFSCYAMAQVASDGLNYLTDSVYFTNTNQAFEEKNRKREGKEKVKSTSHMNKLDNK